MKTSVATVGASVVLIGVSILAVPAVASGAEYLTAARGDSASAASQSTAADADGSAAVSAPRSDELTPLITAWGVAGITLLGGGAIAVAASVHKQRKTAE